MKFLIDRHIPYIEGVFEPFAKVQYLDAQQFTPDSVRNADALIVRTRTRCDQRLLANSSVRFVATATIGFDHIDTDFCSRNRIAWTNAAGCNATSVAQYVGSALAFWAKTIGKTSLEGLTLGIVGVGHVGRAVAHVAGNLLGMKLLLCDPIRQQNEPNEPFVSLETIAREADVITFHTPLTFEGEFSTYYLANEKFFDTCSRKPLIINAARGGVIDEQALKLALKSAKVSDCVVDCWENEPQIDGELLNRALVATPHIAGYSADGKANATMLSVRAVSKFFGLGIDDFSIPNLAPKQRIVCHSAEEILSKLLETYDIQFDHNALISNRLQFEKIRSNYRKTRREVELLR